MINNKPGELGGKYLAPFWDRGKEGVVVEYAECSLTELAHQPNEQRWPVDFKNHRIMSVTFVLSGVKHHAQQHRKELYFSH